MENLISLEQKIIPEMVDLLFKRYQILKKIYYNQPIGRRALSQELGAGERIIRTEVNFLKNQNLIDINSLGMMVTKDGEYILESLQEMIHEINGLNVIEEKLQKYLDIKKVIIVPGNIDEDITVLREMGRVAAKYIKGLIQNNSIIALTGGSSVSQIVDNFTKISKENILVVPARGGMGRDVETQANTLAAKLAVKIGANHKLLHVPDNLSYGALETMINEPDIKDTMNKIAKSDILIFGIGRADDMAKQRGLSDKKFFEIEKKGAVAEAFGYYFNTDGEIIYSTPTIGVNFSDVKNIKHIIAIAGGSNKAEAIIATRTGNSSMVLVTDESASRTIIKLIENGNN